MKKAELKRYGYDFSADYDAIAVFNILDIHKYLMFGFVKQIFVSAMMFFGGNLSSGNPLECVSMNNQERKIRP